MKISFEINKNWGNKWTLDLPELQFEVVSDFYYFALDGFYKPEVESWDKIVFLVGQLLRSWKNKLRILKVGKTTYLPFDYSDQFIGCLRVQRQPGNRLLTTYGGLGQSMPYSPTLESLFKSGIYIGNPSMCDHFVLEESDFSRITNSVIVEEKEILLMIDSAIRFVKTISNT